VTIDLCKGCVRLLKVGAEGAILDLLLAFLLTLTFEALFFVILPGDLPLVHVAHGLVVVVHKLLVLAELWVESAALKLIKLSL
jgi:hypothetical protein